MLANNKMSYLQDVDGSLAEKKPTVVFVLGKHFF